MDKRARVVMLPTNEKAEIVLGQILAHTGETDIPNDHHVTKQHLYITSDDEIKEGDWFIVELFKIDGTSDGLHVEQANSIEDVWINKGVTFRRHSGNCKKIIATTNSFLTIKVGWRVIDKDKRDIYQSLPQPTQSFITKFVEEYNKGNIITDVLVEYQDNGYLVNMDGIGGMDEGDCCWQEKIELKISKDNTITIKKLKNSWSRDEVIELLHMMNDSVPDTYSQLTDEEFDKWINNNL